MCLSIDTQYIAAIDVKFSYSLRVIIIIIIIIIIIVVYLSWS